MKERSKQPQNSKQRIQTTSKNSGQRSKLQRTRTVLTRILSVLDPRAQREAERVVVDRRPSLLKRKRLSLIMDRKMPLKRYSTKAPTPEQEEQFERDFNRLMGEVKREETIREKNNRDPQK